MEGLAAVERAQLGVLLQGADPREHTLARLVPGFARFGLVELGQRLDVVTQRLGRQPDGLTPLRRRRPGPRRVCHPGGRHRLDDLGLGARRKASDLGAVSGVADLQRAGVPNRGAGLLQGRHRAASLVARSLRLVSALV